MEIKQTILIIDDDENLLKILKSEIEDLGKVVFTATSGEDALKLVDQEHFDLIFIDVVLPGSKITDRALVSKIKCNCKNADVPIILITGDSRLPESLSMMMKGADDYILKDPTTFILDVINKIETQIGISSERAILKLKKLANIIHVNHKNKLPSYSIILGAGASINSKCSSFNKIMNDFIEKDVHKSKYHSDVSSEEIFDNEFGNMPVQEQKSILMSHLCNYEISEGYEYLGKLIEKGYFSKIITTNIDSIINDISNRIKRKTDLLTVGMHNDQKIAELFLQEDNRVKILKLHGDIDSNIIAFTKKQIFQFNDLIQSILKRILNGNIISIGHQMRDFDILRCLHDNGGAIWHINPRKPTDYFKTAMEVRASSDNFISGAYGKFDNFFATLFKEIEQLEDANG